MKKTKKKYIVWARVASRAVKDKESSLDFQLKACEDYARRENTAVQRTFTAVGTMTNPKEGSQFREMIAYAKKHAHELEGILLFKIDRAARNLKDFVLLEEIEAKYGLPFIAVTQPVPKMPTGKLLRHE